MVASTNSIKINTLLVTGPKPTMNRDWTNSAAEIFAIERLASGSICDSPVVQRHPSIQPSPLSLFTTG
ncbi:hypothetical protein IFM47457_02391 [Aspergillus lentulus]|nr:hypothetical protein IFM47457_02391 [Aspergillus lentulus]